MWKRFRAAGIVVWLIHLVLLARLISLPSQDLDVLAYYMIEALFLIAATTAFIVWGMRIVLRTGGSLGRIVLIAVLVPAVVAVAMLPAAYLNPWKIANKAETAKLNERLREGMERKFRLAPEGDCYASNEQFMAVATACGTEEGGTVTFFDTNGKARLSVTSADMVAQVREQFKLPASVKFSALFMEHSRYQVNGNVRSLNVMDNLFILLELWNEEEHRSHSFLVDFDGNQVRYRDDTPQGDQAS